MAFISDKYGRKPPARFSGLGMFFSMLGSFMWGVWKVLKLGFTFNAKKVLTVL
jgi:hypothetical protein